MFCQQLERLCVAWCILGRWPVYPTTLLADGLFCQRTCCTDIYIYVHLSPHLRGLQWSRRIATFPFSRPSRPSGRKASIRSDVQNGFNFLWKAVMPSYAQLRNVIADISGTGPGIVIVSLLIEGTNAWRARTCITFWGWRLPSFAANTAFRNLGNLSALVLGNIPSKPRSRVAKCRMLRKYYWCSIRITSSTYWRIQFPLHHSIMYSFLKLTFSNALFALQGNGGSVAFINSPHFIRHMI